MIRFILSLILLLPLVGCEKPDPSPTPTPTPVTPVVLTTYDSIFAWDTALELSNVAPTPTPDPTPNDAVKVGDKCPTCHGTGKSGDGIQSCFQCRGDGIVNEGDPALVGLTITDAREYIPTIEEMRALEKTIYDQIIALKSQLDDLRVQMALMEKAKSVHEKVVEKMEVQTTPYKMTDLNFAQAVSSPVPTLIETYGAGCTPCITMGRYVEDITKRYGGQLAVYKLSVDTEPLTKSKLGITRIPTLFIYQNGQMLDRRTGLFPEENIIQWIKQSVPLSP